MRYWQNFINSFGQRLSRCAGLRSSPLAFQTIQVFLTRVAGLGLALFSNMALTRWLGIAGYGRFSYIIAWVTVLSIPSVGMGTLVVRETAKSLRREDDAALGGLMRWSFRNTLWISGAATLLGMVVVTRLAPHSKLAPILGFAAIPLLCIQTLLGSVFRGGRRVELAIFLNEVVAPALMAAWAGGCLLSGIRGSAAMALGGRLGVVVLVLLAYVLLLSRLSFRLRWGNASLLQIAAWRKSMYSLTLLKGVNTIEARLPVLMLGLLIGPEPVALYSLASRLAETVAFTLSIATMTTGPRLAELHAARDYRGMQQLVTRSTIAISAWAAPVALGLILLGRWLLGWFGPRFTVGYPILIVLVLGEMVNAITGTVGLVMNMGGLERIVLKVHLCGLALTAAACLALIPVCGPVGCALGAMGSMIFWNIALAIQLYRRLGIASSFYAPGFFRHTETAAKSAVLNGEEIR